MIKSLIDLNEKIFLAGAGGMVGSSINRALLRNGYGQKKSGGEILKPSRKELNLLNYEEVEIWFKKNKPTIVIVAAAKVGGIFANDSNPTQFILENLKIQSNIIELAWLNNVKRLLFLGSSCVYPKYAKQPIKEEYLLNGDLEKTNEWYAIAKIAGIKLCQALTKEYKFDAISLMPTNLYGPNDNYHPTNSHVVASLIRKFLQAKNNNHKSVICWGTGRPMREFMHVDDLGEAVVFALENWDARKSDAPKDKFENNLTYLNIGTGQDLSIANLAKKISDIIKYEGKIIWDTSMPDGTLKKLLDVSRINNLGWKAKISLDSGLRRTIRELDLNNIINK